MATEGLESWEWAWGSDGHVSVAEKMVPTSNSEVKPTGGNEEGATINLLRRFGEMPAQGSGGVLDQAQGGTSGCRKECFGCRTCLGSTGVQNGGCQWQMERGCSRWGTCSTLRETLRQERRGGGWRLWGWVIHVAGCQWWLVVGASGGWAVPGQETDSAMTTEQVAEVARGRASLERAAVRSRQAADLQSMKDRAAEREAEGKHCRQ